jgi:hypothetical protein
MKPAATYAVHDLLKELFDSYLEYYDGYVGEQTDERKERDRRISDKQDRITRQFRFVEITQNSYNVASFGLWYAEYSRYTFEFSKNRKRLFLVLETTGEPEICMQLKL